MAGRVLAGTFTRLVVSLMATIAAGGIAASCSGSNGTSQGSSGASSKGSSADGWGAGAMPPGLPGISAVACPSKTHCVGTVSAGSIVFTMNGGASWSTGTLPSGWSTNGGLGGISCATTRDCVAFGSDVGAMISTVVLFTRNGGVSWSIGQSQPGSFGIASCPSATYCIAVGNNGSGSTSAEASTDGGARWTLIPVATAAGSARVSCPSIKVCISFGIDGSVYTTDGTHWFYGAVPALGAAGGNLFVGGLSCSSNRNCVAVGSEGFPTPTPGQPKDTDFAVFTANGGRNWSLGSIPSTLTGSALDTPELTGVSCSSTKDCVAIGGGQGSPGLALVSRNGGAAWSMGNMPPKVPQMFGISCPSTSDCVAVGGANTGITATAYYTTDGGRSWVKGH